MARLDSQLLSTWSVVARAGSINAAASLLGITQPAVSNQLKRLSDWLGEPIYRRHGRGVTLTAAGKRLLRLAHQLDSLLDDADVLRSDIQGLVEGSLVLAASQTNAEFVLLRGIAAFQKRYPGVTVRLYSGNSEDARRQIDVADLVFVEDTASVPVSVSVETRLLLDTQIDLLLDPSHPLTQRSMDVPILLSDVAHEPIVWRELGSGTRERVEAAFRDAHVRPEIRYEFSGSAAVREAVRCGLGVGFVSAMAPLGSDLCTRALSPPIDQQLSVMYQRPLSRAGCAFLSLLDELLVSI